MIKQFKEIDTFFKNDKFSDEELVALKNLISFNYKDLSAVQLAYSLIELQLLKFELIINETPIQKRPLKTVEKTKKLRVKKTHKTNKSKLVGTEGMNTDEKVEYLQDKKLLYILNEITETESKQFFLNILREKGIYKGSIGIKISTENFDEIKDHIRSMLNTNKERDPSLRIKKSYKIKLNRSISKSNTVYDKIKTMNGTGKIIYIRSK